MILIQVIIGTFNTFLGIILILLKDYLADKRIIHSNFQVNRDSKFIGLKSPKKRVGVGWFWTTPNEILKGKGSKLILILGLVIAIIGLAVLITGILDINIT